MLYITMRAILLQTIFWILSVSNIYSYAFRPKTHLTTLYSESPRRNNYHYSQKYYEEALKRLRENNVTTPTPKSKLNYNETDTIHADDLPGITIILKGGYLQPFGNIFLNGEADDDDDIDQDYPDDQSQRDSSSPQNAFEQALGNLFEDDKPRSQPHQRKDNPYVRAFQKGINREKLKSKNFQVTVDYDVKFTDIGGYKQIKDELQQSVDILRNYAKYAQYNVRIPKGLILEGPPGNGKTLLAKSLAGEAGCGFIAVSGSDFQEKYVGVGSSRIRELFDLAKKNEPCIIFIDEIDAVGRHRSADSESSSSERDNTLNALLVELDGFKNNTGVFVVGATNRVDLLDPALIRPGRIDKKIFIGIPDEHTRREVIRIHIRGKPHDESIILEDLVEVTDGLSCSQIENLLNEAMLHTLRYNSTAFTYSDIDIILNKMIAGWQSTEHEFTQDMIERITVHEMGHAILGFLSKYHSKLVKVVLNLSSPKTPGYTIFERSASSIYLKEALFEHLIILLGGRIAEEVVYNVSVTTGAINDFEEAFKLAERMILHYGMGENVLYPNTSEKYKEIVDTEVSELINYAYLVGRIVLENCKPIIMESSGLLQKEKKLLPSHLENMIHDSYPEVIKLKDIFSV